MLNHELVQLALRARARTLSVATTGDIALTATATGYSRPSGSFISDGFVPGLEVTSSGLVSNPTSTIKSVSALSIVLKDARTAESETTASLSALFPGTFAKENLPVTPSTNEPYIEEHYIPGPMTLDSMGDEGDLTIDPTYILNIYTPSSYGINAGTKYAVALLSLFAPSTEILLSTGDYVYVKANPAPFASQRVNITPSFSMVSVTIPLQAHVANGSTENPYYVIFTDVDGDIAISSSITATVDNYQVVTIDSDGDPAAP